MARTPLPALIALVVVQFAFASLAVAGKAVLNQGVSAILLMGLRVFFASLILVALARYAACESLKPRDYLPLFGLSLLGVSVNQGLFLGGLERTTAVNASVLIATIPIFTAAVAILLRYERLDVGRATGILLAFLGALLVLRAESFDWRDRFFVGNVMIVANCLSYSFYLVLARPLLHRYRSSTVVAWTFLMGAVTLAPFAAPAFVSAQATGLFTTPVLVGLAWIVLVPSVLSYSLNNYALKRVRASTVASFVFLQPVIGVLLALWLLPEEHLETRTVLAGLLIIAGVFVVARAERIDVAPTGNPINEDSRPASSGRS